ncbi:cell wall hydrolase [Brevibacillus choshinensis]|uniref:Cell wall hydrolase n=1 Tax=Brevibacillus choshinensis TaxID=54911 RepID=A0ABX7FH12_BRECH|nr:cell wall hydrolase [Brevibacillus choshinensis]QRG65351.1 cell wall hydrolase [Brevibacillus choshinensis]
MTREARTRLFFWTNSFGLMLLCLFVTPTNASAPHPIEATPALVKLPDASAIRAAKQEPKAKPKTSETTAVRQMASVSRDQRPRVIRNGKVKVSERDMELLARLVYAEGRGEPYEGQVAIAAVVLNRVASSQFPNSVREVIISPNAFSPVRNGTLPHKSNDSTRRAVQDAVNGKDPTNGSLYFFNPHTATSDWIFSRPKTVVIGNHTFAR